MKPSMKKISSTVVIVALVIVLTIVAFAASNDSSAIFKDNETSSESTNSEDNSNVTTTDSEVTETEETNASTQTPLEVLTSNPNFDDHGFIVSELDDSTKNVTVKIDEDTAIENAKDSVGDQVNLSVKAISAVLVSFTDTETPTLPETDIVLKDYPVWIVTFQGAEVEKGGPSSEEETITADVNVVIDAITGDFLETFSYSSSYEK